MSKVCACGNPKKDSAKQCRPCYRIWKQLMTSTERKRYDYDTCPTCGGEKYRTSKQCIVCYTKTLPNSADKLVCPKCGGRKHSAAIMCRSCRTKLQWQQGTFKDRDTSRRNKPMTEMWYIGAGSSGGKRGAHGHHAAS